MTAAVPPGAVVCGVDESRAGARAARIAEGIAAGLGAPLLLVHAASPPYTSSWRPDQVVEARRQAAFDRAGYLETVLAPIAIEEPLVVERLVEFGHPPDVLRSVAERTRALVVVVGFSGMSAVEDALLGSTSSALAQEAPCPVVLAPNVGDDAPAFPGAALVCGVDGSETALAAAQTAAELADRLGARLVLAQIDAGDEEGEPTTAAAVDAARLRAPSGRIESESRRGPVAEALLDIAREHDAGLVAVGSRGRGALTAAFLGSVSRRLIKLADRPILVVSPRALESAGPA